MLHVLRPAGCIVDHVAPGRGALQHGSHCGCPPGCRHSNHHQPDRCCLCPAVCSKRAKPDAGGSDWDSVEATPAAANRWDATPGGALGGATPGPNAWDATPGSAAAGGSRWDATPGAALGGATPGTVRRNRWDETPAAVSEWPGSAVLSVKLPVNPWYIHTVRVRQQLIAYPGCRPG